MKCKKCDGEVRERVLRDFDASVVLGLPNVSLINAAIEYVCGACGTQAGVHVPDLEGLEAAAAVERIKSPVRLGGMEVRFLRIALRLKAKELAEMLKIRSETISRWENDHVPMNQEMEKVLRLYVGFGLTEHAPGMSFDPREILRMEIFEPSDFPAPKINLQRVSVMLRRDHRTDEQTTWRTEMSQAA